MICQVLSVSQGMGFGRVEDLAMKAFQKFPALTDCLPRERLGISGRIISDSVRTEIEDTQTCLAFEKCRDVIESRLKFEDGQDHDAKLYK